MVLVAVLGADQFLDIKVLVNKQNKRIDDWTAEQKSVFDDLAMAVSTDGQPMKLINSVKSRYGCDAWTKLTDYYELKMKGDIRTLRKRLNDGEVNKGQKGMVEGDSVSAYIRDLDALHTQLYFCLSEEEHERCPELSDDNMKDVLLANICGSYLETALAFDASRQNKAHQ